VQAYLEPGHESVGCKCRSVSVEQMSSAVAEMAAQSYVAVLRGSTPTVTMLSVTVIAMSATITQLTPSLTDVSN